MDVCWSPSVPPADTCHADPGKAEPGIHGGPVGQGVWYLQLAVKLNHFNLKAHHLLYSSPSFYLKSLSTSGSF